MKNEKIDPKNIKPKNIPLNFDEIAIQKELVQNNIEVKMNPKWGGLHDSYIEVNISNSDHSTLFQILGKFPGLRIWNIIPKVSKQQMYSCTEYYIRYNQS